MSYTPSQETKDVFSETANVLSVEFLQAPAVPADIRFNHQTAIVYNFLNRLMTSVIGTARIDGFSVSYNSGTGKVDISSGILLHKNFVINDTGGSAAIAATGSVLPVYMKITVSRETFDTNPDDTGIPVPNSLKRVPGPNLYTFVVSYHTTGGSVPSDTDTEYYVQLGTIHRTTFVTTETIDLLTRGVTEFTCEKTGTTHEEFLIGVGSLNDGEGFAVIREVTTPATPLNVRLESVNPIEESTDAVSNVNQVAYFSSLLKNGMPRDVLQAEWKWNWDYIEGSGGSNLFIATNMTYHDSTQIGVNDLVGLHLLIEGQDTIIKSNTVGVSGSLVIYVTDLNGDSIDLTGKSGTSGNPVIIHCGADTMYCVLEQRKDVVSYPPLPGGKELERLVTNFDISDVDQRLLAEIPVATIWKLYVTPKHIATKGSTASSDSDRIVLSANTVWNSSASVSSAATEHGCQVTVSGFPTNWVGISALEVAYVLDTTASSPDFSAPAGHTVYVLPFPLTEFNIPMNKRGRYNIAVRPLSSGCVVGTAKETSVNAGGGGITPNDKVLKQISFSMVYHDQELNYDATSGLVTVTKQDNAALAASNPPRFVKDQIFTTQIGGNDAVFKVVDEYEYSGTRYLNVKEMTSYGYDATDFSSNRSYYRGKSATSVLEKELRHIASFSIPNDITITRVEFECEATDASPSNPVPIRVYQEGNESQATSVNVTGVKQVFSEESDLDITVSNGNLVVKIDAYSDVAANNTLFVIGVVTVYYRDKAIRTSENVAGAGGYVGTT